MDLSKKDWSQLMDLASACKFGRLQDELFEWQSKCVESKCFCTLPDTNAVNLDRLLDDLRTKPFLCRISANNLIKLYFNGLYFIWLLIIITLYFLILIT